MSARSYPNLTPAKNPSVSFADTPVTPANERIPAVKTADILDKCLILSPPLRVDGLSKKPRGVP